MRVAVLMPAFNEGERLVDTLQDLAAEATRVSFDLTVFVVDDASHGPMEPLLERVKETRAMKVVFARHPINLGQGASLETARRMATEARWGAPFDAWVTMDSDGQHRARDAFALARAILAGADIALGNRFGGNTELPASRRRLLRLARGFEYATTGLKLADAHNGLRALGPRVIERVCIRQNRMAHATELTRQIAVLCRSDAFRLVEVPVSIRYTEATLAKGQKALGAVSILADLLRGFLFGEPRG